MVNSIEQIINSDSPTFRKFEFQGLKINLIAIVAIEFQKFIELNFPQTLRISDIAAEFANDLSSQRSDWKPEDIKMFIRFIKLNQGDDRFKIFGNSQMITVIKLHEWANYYEMEKSGAREKKYSEFKQIELSQKESPEAVRDHVKKILNRIEFLNDSKKSDKKITPSIKLNDPLNNEDDRKNMFDELPNFSDEQLNDCIESWVKIYKNTDSKKANERNTITEIIREFEIEQEYRKQNLKLKVVK